MQNEFNFSVRTVSIMDEAGKANEKLMPRLSDDEIKELYRKMLTIRIFDDKAGKVQRQGRLGPYISFLGQEACQVGIVSQLRKDDWFFPTYRDSGALIAREMQMKDVLLYWMGDSRAFEKAGTTFPICIAVGTHPPHAAGAAFASKIKKKDFIAVSVCGDGATSRGDFYEAMNFAGVFKLPVIFVVQNNQWAISVPRNKQTATQTIAQKAIAAGIEGVQIDGNDIFSVISAMKYAIEKARAGDGATLIECVTYRLNDHSSADDQKRYRDQKEVEEWRIKEPVERLKKFMISKGLWNEKFEQDIIADAAALVDKGIKDAESVSSLQLDDLFKNTFAEMPWNLEEELEELKEAYKNKKIETTNKVENIEGSFP